MANDMEKLTINLGVVELAQIDVLTEQGLYSNRSDFIRTAVRKHLEGYTDTLLQQLNPIPSKTHKIRGICIIEITRYELEALEKEHQKVDINIIGVLIIGKNVSAELFKRTVEHVVVHGKLVASDEIKQIIDKMNDDSV